MAEMGDSAVRRYGRLLRSASAKLSVAVGRLKSGPPKLAIAMGYRPIWSEALIDYKQFGMVLSNDAVHSPRHGSFSAAHCSVLLESRQTDILSHLSAPIKNTRSAD